MLPTPSTSHVSFDAIYEPAEDSYVFLDTLSSPTESSWLKQRFSSPGTDTPSTATPLIVEVGTGSGVILGFVAGNSQEILGRRDVLALGTDVNRDACLATKETVEKAIRERQCDAKDDDNDVDSGSHKTQYLASLNADLYGPLRPNSVDVLLFNPPYVPTEELPRLPSSAPVTSLEAMSKSDRFEHESYLLSLSYAGGAEGMEVTNRFLRTLPDMLDPVRGVAYVLLCKQNRPEEVKKRIRDWGNGWMAETVGGSGMQAGWEKLVIVRIWKGAIEDSTTITEKDR